jgi:hypothetical protein
MLRHASFLRASHLRRENVAFRQLASRLDWPAVAAFGLPFFLYYLTVAPTIYNLDSAELTTAVAANGLMRATGYPLYLLLGKLWSWLPLGDDMGYRMNLFSAFCGALTILLGERILRRLGVRAWARSGALGLLASAHFFWALSLIAEVYTLHTALMAATILALLRWAESPTPLRFALPVLLMALSLGNHGATALLVPGCIWFVLAQHPRQLLQPRVLAAGVGALLLGVSVFLILPLRYATNPAFNYAGLYDAAGMFHPTNLLTWDGFWQLITGQTFSAQMFGYQPVELGPQIAAYARELWLAFFAVGIGPGIMGMLVLWRRDWRLSGMLSLMFLANAIFYINYRVVDKDTMFLPTYFVFALWLGVGYQWLRGWVHSSPQGTRQAQDPRFSRLRPAMLVPLFALSVVALAVGANWQRVDLSDDWSTREQSEAILAQAKPNALIFGWWNTVPAIQYLQLVEGRRPDVAAINRFLIGPEDMNQLILTAVNQRPVYVDNPSIVLLRETTITAAGPLYRLEPKRPAVVVDHWPEAR